jgi:hypothetical protein
MEKCLLNILKIEKLLKKNNFKPSYKTKKPSQCDGFFSLEPMEGLEPTTC